MSTRGVGGGPRERGENWVLVGDSPKKKSCSRRGSSLQATGVREATGEGRQRREWVERRDMEWERVGATREEEGRGLGYLEESVDSIHPSTTPFSHGACNFEEAQIELPFDALAAPASESRSYLIPTHEEKPLFAAERR